MKRGEGSFRAMNTYTLVSDFSARCQLLPKWHDALPGIARFARLYYDGCQGEIMLLGYAAAWFQKLIQGFKIAATFCYFTSAPMLAYPSITMLCNLCSQH